MAYYAALVSLVQLLKEINLHEHPYSSYVLDKHHFHLSLYEKFKLVQELLEDYSPKDAEAADCLQARIRDAACETQDIIESHISAQIPVKEDDAMIPAVRKPRRVKRVFRHLVSALRKPPGQPKPRIVEKEEVLVKKDYQDLEKVKAEVDSIVEELTRIKESQTAREHVQPNASASTQAAKVEESSRGNTMVGFEEHLMTIKGQLCGESSRLEVISVVGIGGLGKTTLARNIFDDKLIKESFDCRAWITVSQDYHWHHILLALVYSLNIYQKKLSEVEDEVLVERIYKHLFGRRYLIIMDDMWETKVWDEIKKILPNDQNGSRIMITTRLLQVAHYADTSGFLHELQCLDPDQSWNLFCQNVVCPPTMEGLGRLMAKNCRGLPLAIVVVAGLLAKANTMRHDWEEIAETVSSVAIDQNDEHLTKILSLSYDHLPHHLKPCFLYLGGFPEDYEIHVSTLLRLWVAEGLLQPIESKSPEEAAEEYFEDLVKRNLVLITRRKSNGKFKYCSIHDLLRDLCSQRARYENFLHCLHKGDGFHRELTGNIRRLYIQRWDESFSPEYKKQHFTNVRAVLCFAKDGGTYQHHLLSVASNFKLLREFDARNIRFYSFPEVVVHLFHLRFLALGASKSEIPPSISKLQKLQTLIVGDGVISLPYEFWKMPQITHLMFQEVRLPQIRIADELPLLERLHTLQSVRDFKFTSDTIKKIPNLKKLKVYCTDLPERNWDKFRLNNLAHFRQLETLEIEFSWSSSVATPLPENFAFPSTLIKLSLVSCGFPWKDMRHVGTLPNLQILKLRDGAFVGEEWEPVEGEFLELKFLLMERLDLKYWRADDTNFPRLEQLHIRNCKELEEIPPEIGDISTLQSIGLSINHPTLESSALRIQEQQRDQGNDEFQVLNVR